MMKSLVITLVLAAPAIASADRNFLGSGGGSHDCNKDGVVNINGGSGKYTLTGSCKTVNVAGGQNKITAAAIGELNVNGAGNTVDTDTLAETNIVGSNNKVTYKNGNKPAVSQMGTNNSVTKGAGGGGGGSGDKPAEKPAPPDKGGGDAKDGDRAIIDCKKTPTWSTGNGSGRFKFVGACTRIAVNGGENDLYIDQVENLDIGGGENNIFVVTVGTISVSGADNKIAWKKALKGDKPTLKGQPNKNTITKVP